MPQKRWAYLEPRAPVGLGQGEEGAEKLEPDLTDFRVVAVEMGNEGMGPWPKDQGMEGRG